jgi:hypothetical protein
MHVPAGVYTSARITFDFTNATCVLAGQSQPAAILRESGVPVTGPLTLAIDIGAEPLAVLPNVHTALEIDLDLWESVVVNERDDTIDLEPLLGIHADGSTKAFESTGALFSVDTVASSIVANVESSHGVFSGQIAYEVDEHTIFQLDGVPASGAEGLLLLSARAPGTPLHIVSTIDPASPELQASYVEAGHGTPEGGDDLVDGLVIDRVGNPGPGSDVTFHVLGRSTNAAHTSSQYDATFEVRTAFAATKVVRFASAQALDTDDVNIGQRVRVFGALSGVHMDAAEPASVLRELESRAFGHAIGPIAPPARALGTERTPSNGGDAHDASGAPGTLTMDLVHVDLIPSSAFTWSDGGSSPSVPTSFTASVPAFLGATPVMSGSPMEVHGFFSSTTNDAQDLAALSIVDLDVAPALLSIKNEPGGFEVGVHAGSTRIEITIVGSPGPFEQAIVDRGFAGATDLPTSAAAIVEPADSSTMCMLRNKSAGTITAYVAFAPFSQALGAALANDGKLKVLGAIGDYSESANALRAKSVSAVIE